MTVEIGPMAGVSIPRDRGGGGTRTGADRIAVRKRYRLHSRDPLNAALELQIEAIELRAFVAIEAGPHCKQQNVLPVKAEVEVLQGVQRPEQEPGADQQEQAKRYLAGHQDLAGGQSAARSCCL